MPSHPKPSKVLVVEGNNDAHIFWNLLDKYQFTKEVRDNNGFVIDSVGGFEKIQPGLRIEDSPKPTDQDMALSLSIRIKNGDVTCLGIVVDADYNKNRWMSLRNVIIERGYPQAALPAEIPENGFLLLNGPSNLPKLGVWIMPNNVSEGMIEDFAQSLRDSVADRDNLWQLAQEAVANIPVDQRLFPIPHTMKAIIHTWLAWQEEPGKPIGQAIKAGYLKHNAKPALGLMNWFNQLFDLGAVTD